MPTDLDLFRAQTSLKSEFQNIEVNSSVFLSSEMRKEGVSLRKTLFLGNTAAAGATFLFSISTIADPSIASEFKHLSKYSALWSLLSLITSYLCMMSFTSHLIYGYEHNRLHEKSKQLVDLNVRTLEAQSLSSNHQGTQDNRIAYDNYIKTTLTELKSMFETSEADRRTNEVKAERSRLFATKLFCLSAVLIFLSWVTPLASFLVYEYF